MQYARGPLRHECDDGQCTQALASRDDLDRRQREKHVWADETDEDDETEEN